MSKVDTSNWKNFKLVDIAELSYGNKFDMNKMTYANPSVKFVSRTGHNNGISDTVDEIPGVEPFPAGSLTLAFGGSIGSCFLQEAPFYTGQNVGVVQFPKEVPRDAKLFLASSIQKMCRGRFVTFSDEINKHFKKDLEIYLPVTEQDVPDWDYMQERIAELEQERIAELEQYLVATGLNDYELTDEDREELSREKKMREFRMGDLFEKQELKWRSARAFDKRMDTSPVRTEEFSLPLTNAKHGDNGIMFYGRPDEWDSIDMSIDIVSNGAIATGDVYPQPDFVGVLWDSYVIKLKHGEEINENVLMFLASVIEKTIKLVYSYYDKAVWNKVQHTVIQLPICTDAANSPVIDPEKTYHPDGYVPDWDFMSRYIRAIEKMVVRDVVRYKDEMIRKMKQAVL